MLLTKLVNRFIYLFYKGFSLLNKTYSISINGKSYSIKTSTVNEVHRAVTFYSKEPETLRWIDSFNKLYSGNGMVFFDIGANIGIYSIYAAAQHQNIKVFSFEPESQSFSSLCSNFAENKLYSAMPYQFAIANKVGIGELKSSSMAAGAGAASLDNVYKFTSVKAEEVFTQGVYFSSVDNLVYGNGLPVPNFIKIDVDGIESDILLGAKQVLAESVLKGVLVEFQYRDEEDLNPMIDYLKSFGLLLTAKSEWISGTKESGLSSRNFIFQK